MTLSQGSPPFFAMQHVACPHCGVYGRVSTERVIQARAALTIFYCDECHCEWDETESGTQMGTTRTRPPKTHQDKTS